MAVISIFIADDDFERVITALSAPRGEEVSEEAAKDVILEWIRARVNAFDWSEYSKDWEPTNPDVSSPREWVRPTHAENAYKIGDVVFWEGGVYRVVAGDGAGNNSWAPDEYGWEKIG